VRTESQGSLKDSLATNSELSYHFFQNYYFIANECFKYLFKINLIKMYNRTLYEKYEC